MERNIGDQLKKAFEAYRQASIEKDSAKKELQEKTEYYQSYTRKLEQRIEDQNELIAELKALLSPETKPALDGVSQVYHGLQKQEVESFSSCNHQTDGPLCSHQTLLMGETMHPTLKAPCSLPGISGVERRDLLDMFWELQGHFQLIQALTQKQTNYLRNTSRRNIKASEQQFSIPIQCTEVSAERSEGPLGPFSATLRAREEEEEEEKGGEQTPVCSGVAPEEGCFPPSLTGLGLRYPPSPDSGCEFLNSAVGGAIDELTCRQQLGQVTSVSMVTEDQDQSLGMDIPLTVLHANYAPANLTHKSICGPQQLLWSPDLCGATAQGSDANPPPRGPDTGKCEFCNDLIPPAHMFSHLNSHFQSPTSNRH